MNNPVFGKTMENVRKKRDVKLVTTNKKRNHLVSEPSYHTIKWFPENLLSTVMRKKVKMNKPVYLGISILKISKTLNLIWLRQNKLLKQRKTKLNGYR